MSSSTSSISDPFPLASYDLPRQGLPTNQHVYVSSHVRKRDAFVTATVQGDGVYTLDVATLHAVWNDSTFGPRAAFPCPSVTRREGSAELITTYTAQRTDSGATRIRCAREGRPGKYPEDGPQMEVEYDVAQLYAPTELPERLISVLRDGGITLLDNESLAPLASHPSSASATLCKSFLFPRAEWLPDPSDDGVVVALILQNSSKDVRDFHLTIVSISTDDELAELYSSKIPVDNCEIADISLGPSGHLTLLTPTGAWHAYHLTRPSPSPSPSSPLSLSPLSQPLTLTNLSLTPPSPALLALTDSHVLLAAPTATSSEIAFAIWDLRYGVLLAEHCIAAPAALGGGKGKVRVALEHAGRGQAAVVLSPEGKGGKGRSVVLVLPYSVPERSTIRGAMGRGEAGKRWLLASAEKEEGERVAGMSKREREVVEKGGVEAVKKLEAEEGELSYAFVKAMVREERWDEGVVGYLLERGLVTAGMMDGRERGLLEVLRVKGDWKAIQVAFDTVPDLSEDSLISLLHFSLSAPTSPIPLPTLLRLIAQYPTSAPALRKAIKVHLGSNPEDLVKVLEVVESWVGRWASKEGRVRLETTKEGEERRSRKDLPPFDKVLSFLTTLLDASFLALLAHPPAHALLRRLAEHVQPEIAFGEVLEQLRAPLEPYVRAGREKKEDGEEKGDWRKRRKERFERQGAVGVYQVEELVL